MSDTTQIDGPGQAFNAMNADETVADRLRPFLNQGAATATFGNLLTLPLGGGLLYVTPVYTQRQGSSGVLPGAALRGGPVRPVGRHRRHPAGRRWTRCSRATPGAETEEGEPETTEEPPTTGEPDNPAATKALNEAETAFDGRRQGAHRR